MIQARYESRCPSCHAACCSGLGGWNEGNGGAVPGHCPQPPSEAQLDHTNPGHGMQLKLLQACYLLLNLQKKQPQLVKGPNNPTTKSRHPFQQVKRGDKDGRRRGLSISTHSSTMNSKVGDAARTGAMAKSFKTGRPLPKRGQIKSRIAANAFHSIVSAISRASSSSSRHRHPSSRRAFSRD
ncbi:hypothetical protein SAY87_015222 [Trapa incisa]|uniref:Uncharacterized protein n=1 Tax=Trapa incisa TaxID=236973 RepID=A0AAN7GPU8_9MYRT|nr:hypothetical protein SAY87_015222 [Trapa incisa]